MSRPSKIWTTRARSPRNWLRQRRSTQARIARMAESFSRMARYPRSLRDNSLRRSLSFGPISPWPPRSGRKPNEEKLVARLPEVLDEIEKRGGKRKAVIFTESVRTQNYLANLLAQNGYAGHIVLMNGSNSDPESQALYRAWLDQHKGTDAVSGSKSADMKAAVVEAFRGDDKTILIATESGAEGINLQFCSVLVNFDLPWNPQRVEQRIGRCHRYGQKIDVTVVNMLNLRNKAEKRVHDLLDQKFRLFSGVFGASDEVLGVIESGIDFERKVASAVQRGRTDAEVEQEFEKIEEQLSEKIA